MTIRDILEPLASGWRGWTIDQLDGTSFIKGEMETIEETIAEAEQAINAYILGEVMELIGEDDTAFKLYGSMAEHQDHEAVEARNNLRVELRNKANKKWGKQDG